MPSIAWLLWCGNQNDLCGHKLRSNHAHPLDVTLYVGENTECAIWNYRAIFHIRGSGAIIILLKMNIKKVYLGYSRNEKSGIFIHSKQHHTILASHSFSIPYVCNVEYALLVWFLVWKSAISDLSTLHCSGPLNLYDRAILLWLS